MFRIIGRVYHIGQEFYKTARPKKPCLRCLYNLKRSRFVFWCYHMRRALLIKPKREMEVNSSLENSSSQFDHTPFYCEENVYMLCKKLCAKGVADADGSDLFVVFISNEKKQIPLWHQKASTRADGIILWDYHVICIQKRRSGDSSCLVWDLNSSLPFPSPLASYVSETIRPSFQLFSEYQRYFRIVHAPIFLRCFASDRRHMKDSAGEWIAEPPSYEPIVAEDKTVHNLNEYIEIRAEDLSTNVVAELINDLLNKKLGVVINGSQLEEFFSQVS